MKLIVFGIMILYLISPVDLSPGFLDDLIVMLVSGGYLMSGKSNEHE